MKKEEIKKALESCVAYKNVDCNNCLCCPYDGQILCQDVLCKDSLALITEQEQKIERLKAEIKRLEGVINDQNKLCRDCKKSVKEFAEELKAKTMCITEYEDGTRILQTSNKLIDQSVEIFLTNY